MAENFLEIKDLMKSFGTGEAKQEVLRGMNFTVNKGEFCVLLGPSGSGKSTVVNLIPRLYDVCGGTVKIAGVDVRDFDLTYLREQIGVVTQESYLFNGTILENLRYAKSDALPMPLGGLGIAIISTSSGLMTQKECMAKGIGGEIVAYVW